MPELPVLDEREMRWSDSQRQRLAGALLARQKNAVSAIAVNTAGEAARLA